MTIFGEKRISAATEFGTRKVELFWQEGKGDKSKSLRPGDIISPLEEVIVLIDREVTVLMDREVTVLIDREVTVLINGEITVLNATILGEKLVETESGDQP